MQVDIFGHLDLFYEVLSANIAANLAVFAGIEIDDSVCAFDINCAVWAVILAVFALCAAGRTNVEFYFFRSRGAARNNFLPLVWNNGDEPLRAGIYAAFAAYTLVRVYNSNAVYDVDGVVSANLCASTAAKAAGLAKPKFLQV